MERRKFLIGAGSLAAGAAAATGTGAFTSVSADRGIDINVAGDASAFLSFEKSDNANSNYVQMDGNTISLQFDGSHATSTSGVLPRNVGGLNEDSFTIIGDLFDITNRGTQDIFVYMLQDPDGDGNNELGTDEGVSFSAGSANTYYNNQIGGQGLLNTQDKTGLPDHPVPAAIRVDVGNTMPEVGAIFGGYLGDITELDIDLKIVAESVESYDNGDSVPTNDESFDIPGYDDPGLTGDNGE